MLIRIRLVFYSLALLHLVFIVCYLLSIDFTVVDEPFRMYHRLKWKLITIWFNLITLAYLPVCVYCEWRKLRGETVSKHVEYLNRFRYICFTSIILPTTLFADSMYWRLCNINSEFITPKGLEKIVPNWTQHSLHTVSLVVVLLDLGLVPRTRPKSLKPGISIMFAFLTIYTSVCVHSKIQGELLYPVIGTFSNFEFFIVITYMFVEHSFYYTAQWFIIDLVWKKKNHFKKI